LPLWAATDDSTFFYRPFKSREDKAREKGKADV
jgi:hypothetical protein